MEFDAKRAMLGKPDQFKRFRVSGEGEVLSNLGLDPDTPLIIVDRKGQRIALLLRQMVYHHLAQGELAGEPYIVSF